jgi:biopolymer transport protein ExbD
MKVSLRKVRCDVPSVAMGDIAFNLLIFLFILARTDDDSHVEWRPATTASVQPIGVAPVSVIIDKDSKLYLNGRQIAVSSLSGAVAEKLGDSPAGQRRVVLKVDREALASRFEPVIAAIAEAGGELVHVLEDEKAER